MSGTAARLLSVSAIAMVAGLGADPVVAQNSQPPVLVPGLERFSLPGQPQQTPAPSPTPTPAATVVPPPVRATIPSALQPTPSTTPTARSTSTSRTQPRASSPVVRPAERPTATPTPVALPSVTSAPVVTPGNIVPTSAPTPSAAATPASDNLPPWWPWAAGGGVVALALAAIAWLIARRRRSTEFWEEPVAEEHVAPTPESVVVPPLPITPDAVTPSAAVVEINFKPRRAGTNLLSAAVEYEIGLRNAGDATANGVQVEIQMLSASAAQDAQIATLFAAPVSQSVSAPFDLAPGQDVELTGMAMLPRAALNIFTVEQRQLFVPILTVRAVYDRGAGEMVQTTAAHVIGVDRGEGAKLAPFRADAAPRMFDTVVARPL